VSFRRVVFGESILTNRPPPPLQPSTIAGTPSILIANVVLGYRKIRETPPREFYQF
jgi:hypothetical protein